MWLSRTSLTTFVFFILLYSTHHSGASALSYARRQGAREVILFHFLCQHGFRSVFPAGSCDSLLECRLCSSRGAISSKDRLGKQSGRVWRGPGDESSTSSSGAFHTHSHENSSDWDQHWCHRIKVGVWIAQSTRRQRRL